MLRICLFNEFTDLFFFWSIMILHVRGFRSDTRSISRLHIPHLVFIYFLSTGIYSVNISILGTFFLFFFLIIILFGVPPICMTPRHSRLQQPAVGLLPQLWLIGEGVSVPELLSAPLSSVGAQPATLMAAAPVKQRSGSGGPRAQLPPCYYEGYLEKRGPKEKVGSPAANQLSYQCMLVGSVCVNVYVPRTGWSTIPR